MRYEGVVSRFKKGDTAYSRARRYSQLPIDILTSSAVGQAAAFSDSYCKKVSRCVRGSWFLSAPNLHEGFERAGNEYSIWAILQH